MRIIGLTGGIASGKSTIASWFSYRGFPVFDSDKMVHTLMGPKGIAVPAILSKFDDCGGYETGIDRQALGKQVFGAPHALRDLEGILHPLIAEQRAVFLKSARQQRSRAVILDVPLLFETKTDVMCDVTLLAWAPDFLITKRALLRPHMSLGKLRAIQKQQMSFADKSKLADETIATGLGYAYMTRQLNRLLCKWQLR